MIIKISLIFIGFAILLGLIRMLKGPSVSDRLLAADTLTTITTALIVLISFLYKRVIYMDVAIVYAVIGFIGIVVVARYLEGGIK